MTTRRRPDSLATLASRSLKLRVRGIFAHAIEFDGDDGVSEALVGALDPSTCSQLAGFARYLGARRVRIASPIRLRDLGGHTLDVVVAFDLETGRQAVVRLSDGKQVKCGKVRSQGVETLRAALKEARERDGGALAPSNARTTTPPRGRGRFSRSPINPPQ